MINIYEQKSLLHKFTQLNRIEKTISLKDASRKGSVGSQNNNKVNKSTQSENNDENCFKLEIVKLNEQVTDLPHKRAVEKKNYTKDTDKYKESLKEY